jgi:hypothetical protein
MPSTYPFDSFYVELYPALDTLSLGLLAMMAMVVPPGGTTKIQITTINIFAPAHEAALQMLRENGSQ